MRVLLLLLLLVAACAKEAAPAKGCADVATCEAQCAKDGRACRKLGKLRLRCQPPQFDLARAAEAYTKGCDAGDASSCAALALQVQDGRGVPWDLPRAVELYRRACDGGSGVACFNLGGMYFGGNGVAQDLPKANELMVRAEKQYRVMCEGPEPDWCPNLGYLYEHGMLGPKDPTTAAGIYRKACDDRGDPDSCASLALLEIDGNGVAANRDAALQRLEKTCRTDGALACGILARVTSPEPGTIDARGRELLEKACDGGDAQSCSSLAAFYALGRGIPVDLARSAVIGQRACDLGNSLACFSNGEELRETDPPRAMHYLVRACHIGEPEACVAAAKLVVNGRVREGSETVQMLVTRACALGHRDACSLLNAQNSPPR